MEKKVASFLDLLVGWLFFVCFYADVQDWKASMMKILLAGCAAERSLRGGSIFGENFTFPVVNILSSDPCVHGPRGLGSDQWVPKYVCHLQLVTNATCYACLPETLWHCFRNNIYRHDLPQHHKPMTMTIFRLYPRPPTQRRTSIILELSMLHPHLWGLTFLPCGGEKKRVNDSVGDDDGDQCPCSDTKLKKMTILT